MTTTQLPLVERPATEEAAERQTFNVPAEPLGDEALARVRFGRNRFLRLAGTTLFGAVVSSVLKASPALACTAASPPPLCGPSPACCCCNSSSGCCERGCTVRWGDCGGPSGHGWHVAQNIGNGCQRVYFCGDYWSAAGQNCICRTGPVTIC